MEKLKTKNTKQFKIIEADDFSKIFHIGKKVDSLNARFMNKKEIDVHVYHNYEGDLEITIIKDKKAKIKINVLDFHTEKTGKQNNKWKIDDLIIS